MHAALPKEGMGGASVNRCVNSSGGVPHRLLFYAYPIGILRSLVYVSQEIRSIETTWRSLGHIGTPAYGGER